MHLSSCCRPIGFRLSGVFGSLLFATLLTLPGFSQAQIESIVLSDSLPKKTTHDIGVAAGFTTGVGLAYRVWRNNWGAQLAAGAINPGDLEFYSVGFSYMYALKASSMHRFFVYQGNHFISLTQYLPEQTMYYYTNGVSTYSNTIPARTDEKRYVNTGIGLGFEFFENEGKPSQFGFSTQAGMAAYRSFTRANFTAEVSFMFRFE